MPVTYANYPTAEYLPLPTLDFLTFNVFLERQADLRSYLTRLHHLAGDRPLVLGELGLDAGQGEDRQAKTLDWQYETAVERGVAGTNVFSWTDEWWVADKRVEGWHFGLTTEDRTPRPALARGPAVELANRARHRVRMAADQRRDLRARRGIDARRVPEPHHEARLPRARGDRRRRRLDRRHAAHRALVSVGARPEHSAQRPLGGAQRRVPRGQRRARRLPRRGRLSDP